MNNQEHTKGSRAVDLQSVAAGGRCTAVERLRLGCRLDAPACARGWIREACIRHGLHDLIDDAALLVSEVVTNVVLHAGTHCTVIAEFGVRALLVRVVEHERTSGFPRYRREQAECGRGLTIVAALATDWGVTPEGTGKAVWFALAAPDRVAGAPAT